ncbi:MAG: alpha/beta fold hydrolase [Bacteroidales bacterium]|jgi:pimeloyl-ACP methyl ester carboxylesterase|nr:alpha/beta fold hydrolase [Bacteroidales bacterium]
MLQKRYILRYFVILFISAFIFTTCRKDDVPEYEHFVRNTLASSYSESYIDALLSYAGQSYPEIAGLQQHVTTGVNVYKVVYRTMVGGKRIEASGLVSIPDVPGEYPVLSFQNGTNTLNAACPSEDPGNYMYQLVEYIASMGFVVVIPDYPGFGSSSDIPHPYLLSEPTVNSITDMFRAVNEATDEFPGVQLKNEYYLIGYSQGGWATMSLHKYLETEAPDEFTLAGTVCGAGPYDLYHILTGMVSSESYPVPAYLGYIIYAYTFYDYIKNPVNDLLNEPYASRLSTLYDGNHTADQINSQLSTSIPELVKEDFRTNYSDAKYSSVRNSLVTNSIEPYNTQIPLLLVHGDADTQVPVSSTNLFYDKMILAGTSSSVCTKTIIPGLDHGDAIMPCMTRGLEFLIDIRDNK